MKKKLFSVIAVGAAICTMLVGCGSEAASDNTVIGDSATNITTDNTLAGTEITFLNTKGEIQAGLEELAEAFESETGITVDILACGAGEVPYTKITSAYNSGTAPTMAMLDTTDIVALAKEYAIDLTDEKWAAECENQITKLDGKLYSFPFCIEGRGLIYNKKAIEDTLGTTFDANSINSYDSLKKLLEELRAGGMENPVVLSKEDWSLAAHQLGFIYDTYDGTTNGSAELIDQLKSGELNPMDYERFNQFTDTLDLLLEYNINQKDPLGALYEQDPIFLVDGNSAIWANGGWAWPNLKDAGASDSDEYGFLPFVLGNDTSDFANNQMQASASKQVMIDRVQATEQQISAAKEFLNWIVYSENGQKLLVEKCALIPACSNNQFEIADPLGRDIMQKLKENKTYSASYIAPSDHWSVMGAVMQQYITNKNSISKEELAQKLSAYWENQK